jgi:RHS repeat-associated protein
MHSSLLLRHGVLRITFLAFVLILGSSAGATQQLQFIECPSWSAPGSRGYYTSPQQAAFNSFTSDTTIPEACKPLYVIGCSVAPGGPQWHNCTGMGRANPGCPDSYVTIGATIQTLGTGQPGLPATNIVYGSSYGKSWCAYWADEPHHPKDRGDPDCPKCNNPQGNPVNVATGNKFQREVDFAMQGDGALEFVRFYNSFMPPAETGVGSGWNHTWSRKLQIEGTTSVRAIRSDGKVYSFTRPGSTWIGDPDVPERLQASGGGWTLTTRNDDVETYSSTGQLVSVKSRAGKLTTLVYSDGHASGPNGALMDDGVSPLPAGYLIRVVDYAGKTLTFVYGNNGNVAHMTDPGGGIYRYGYDSRGALATIQYPDDTTRTYVYNESANISGTATLQFALTGIIDENNSRFATFKYSDDLALSTEHAGGVDKYQFTYNGASTSYVDPLVTTRSSPILNILNVMQLTGTTQGSSAESYTFDPANRNLTSYRDYNGNLTCFTFGSRNLELSRTEGLSSSGTCTSRVTTGATRTITTEWHATWRLPRRIAEPLKITTNSYNGDPGVSCANGVTTTAVVCSKTVQATTDSDGSLGFSAVADGPARVWNYTWNAVGMIRTIDGPRTDVTDLTTYAYYTTDDPSGDYKTRDLASITNALGQVTQFTEYDAAGRLKKMIDPNGLETKLDYWPRGWLMYRKVGTTAAGYETTSYEYDNVGQLTKVTLPDASYVSYTYDAAHRLTDVYDGLGNHIAYTLDVMGNRTNEQAYDTSGTPVRAHTRVIDGLNRLAQDIGGTSPSTQITRNGYDNNGNLTSITDPLSRIASQIYDARNRLTEVRDPFNGTGAPTRYAYNGQDQLTQVTDPAALATNYTLNGHGEVLTQVSPDTGTTTFTYDPASNLKTKLDARGIQATYSYDAINRVTQIVYPDQTVTYTYDTCANGIGRLCSVAESPNSITTSYAYDVKGRVTSKTQVVSNYTRTMGYAYNSAGQLSTVTTPSGKQVVYSYSNNRPVSVTVGGVKLLDTVFYEPFGPNGGWHWGNSTQSNPNTHTRTFDKDFRTTRVTSDLPASGTQPYFDRQIGWDDQSRVQSITDFANGAFNASYGYDGLDRVTSATQGTSSWGYTYNGVGDRLTSTVNGATTNYGYFAGSHKLQSLSGAQSKSYTVDAAGNMTSDGTTTWTYAGNNRATQAGTTSFQVNAVGQRMSKIVAGGWITRFVYDEAGRLWGEYDTYGNLAETFWLDDLPVGTFARLINPLLALGYIHTDHVGTPRMITRASDNAVGWRWDNTEPFGNSHADSPLGIPGYNLRFPGQYFDQETGTHYNYHRDYDPRIGRYIESDPIGMLGGINTYVYVTNKPLARTDILGLKGCGTGWSEPITPNLWFGSCCDAHDDCYDDCKNRPTKVACDHDFCGCVNKKCVSLGNRAPCSDFAAAYCHEASSSDTSAKAFNNSRKKCDGPRACTSLPGAG